MTRHPRDELRGAMVTRTTLRDISEASGLADPSIVVYPLDQDAWEPAALDAGRSLYPASMIKTPLVAAALAEVARGRLRLNDRLEVTAANMTHNDAPSPLVPGYWSTLTEVCELAISRSDNVATNVLFDVVGRERATQIAQNDFGLQATAFYRKLSGADPLITDPQWDGVHRNSHPASDAARMFELIAFDRVPHSDLLRGSLTRQYWNDKLSKGLRAGDRFVHKTGDTDDVTHDGGILITAVGRSYVVVAYTGMPSNAANNAKFGPFMEHLRELL